MAKVTGKPPAIKHGKNRLDSRHSCLQKSHSLIHIKADFHSAFFVVRATFLLFKLNSSLLRFTRKLRRQKKKVAQKKPEWKSAFTDQSEIDLHQKRSEFERSNAN